MEAMAIDLSHWNTIPNDLLPAKQSGVIGCIHKATEGLTYVDPELKARHYLAQEADMLWGMYHFMRPGDIEAQARHFLRTAEPFMNDETILVADHEDAEVSLANLQTFCEKVSFATGKICVIYSGHVLKEQVAKQPNPHITKYPLWLAQYGPKAELPVGWVSYFLWQYSKTGSVPGISGDCDVNTGAKDRAYLDHLWHYYASAKVPEPAPAPATGDIYIRVPRGTKVHIEEYDNAIKERQLEGNNLVEHPRDAESGLSPRASCSSIAE